MRNLRSGLSFRNTCLWTTRWTCIVAGWAILHAAQAATLSVSTTAELQNAMASAQAGDVIIVDAGAVLTGNRSTSGDPSGQGLFYSGQNGTASSKIVLKSADPANPATLQGSAVDDGSYGIHLNGDHWEIRDLVVRSAQKGIMLDNSNYTLISNVEVYNIGDEGVHFRDGSSYGTIENSYVHDVGQYQPGYGEGIYVGSAGSSSWNKDVHNTIIRNNQIGPNVTAEHIDVKEYTLNTLIEYNTFDGTGITGLHYADSFVDIKGNDAIIRYNTGYRNGNSNVAHAFEVHSTVTDWGYNNDFTHNTVYLDVAEPYVINAPSGSAKACLNKRDPDGNMYKGNVDAYYCGEDPEPAPAPEVGSDGSLIFSASDDSYIRGGSYADKNYGQDANIYVRSDASDGNTRVGFFKFRLGDHVSSADSAVLRVYGKPSGTTTFAAYAVVDEWCEECITWNNAPASGTAAGSVPASAVTQYWELDVTAYVSAQIVEDQTVSFTFQEDSEKYTELSSKEGTNPPELVIMEGSGGDSDSEPPTAPSNLAATTVSSEQIDLTWDASTDNVGVAGYKVYRDGVEVGTSSTESYSDTGLTAATTYSYTVKAYDSAGNLSQSSNTAQATTLEASPSSSMYTEDIAMALDGQGGYTWATATVLILDDNGNPVADAVVSGQWSGNTTDADSGVTGADGKVTIQSDKVKNPGKGTYTFTVESVTHDQLTYDSSQNVITSNSITKN